MATPTPVITLDGPSGSGKGTIGSLLAAKLGWPLLDSGALYRLVALAASKRGLAFDDEPALAELAGTLAVRFTPGPAGQAVVVWMQSEDVSEAIRSEVYAGNASRVAALPGVRGALLARQRAFRKPPGLVADGRDMGTVVFPDATIKFFFTASLEERARRRHNQLKEKGINVNLPSLLEEIARRDQRDREREVAPLCPALDAWIIDTTEYTVKAVLHQVLEVAKAQGLCAT